MLHGFYARGRGGRAHAEQIRRDVERDIFHRFFALALEHFLEKRREEAVDRAADPRLFHDLQDGEPDGIDGKEGKPRLDRLSRAREHDGERRVGRDRGERDERRREHEKKYRIHTYYPIFPREEICKKGADGFSSSRRRARKKIFFPSLPRFFAEFLDKARLLPL